MWPILLAEIEKEMEIHSSIYLDLLSLMGQAVNVNARVDMNERLTPPKFILKRLLLRVALDSWPSGERDLIQGQTRLDHSERNKSFIKV